jgi:hypothetical protein
LSQVGSNTVVIILTVRIHGEDNTYTPSAGEHAGSGVPVRISAPPRVGTVRVDLHGHNSPGHVARIVHATGNLSARECCDRISLTHNALRDTSIARENPTVACAAIKVYIHSCIVHGLNREANRLDILHLGSAISCALELSHTTSRGRYKDETGTVVDSENGGIN